jgi:hypothetical protein
MLCNTKEVGIRVYLTPSFPIITAIKKASRWHRLRCCMVDGVRLHCFGMRLENGKCSDLTFCMRPRSKFIWLGRTCESHNPQKSYADHRRELSFEVGDFVYLKVSPMRGLSCSKVRGKLTPRFIGPFKILEKRGEVAYQLELPP